MILLDKEPVQRVGKIIKEFNQNLSVSVLETSARTALEAASSLGCEVGAIVKSLLFKTDNKFSLFLVAGDKKASLKKIKKNIKFNDVSMATAEDVKKITGFTIAPTSHPKEDAASKAVLADVSKTLTLKFWSNSLIILPTLRTGSLSSNVIIQL